MKKVILLGIFIFVPFISGCQTSVSLMNHGGHSGGFFEYRVNFNANGPKPMQTPSANRNCTKGAGPRLGCIKFETDTYGVIVFGLVGERDNKKCGDAGVNWVITKVELSDSGDVDTSKGTDFGTPVPSWVQDSFYGVDASTGFIYDKSWQNGRTSVAVINLNNHSGDKDLWYRVTATNCAETDDTNTSDPRVENMGK